MHIEQIVLISAWVVGILVLLCFTPRDQLREAQVIFLFKQFMTWIFGLLVVQYGWIEYPVREFPRASGTSFSFEYFLYPSICVVFILRFPERKHRLLQIGWYLLFPTWMTFLEVLIERYTLLIHYKHWSWYWTWITLLITFFISHLYYHWFFKRKKPASQ